MQFHEDSWIQTLIEIPSDPERSQVYKEVRSAYAPLARKAEWMTMHLRRRGVPVDVVHADEHIDAWIEFLNTAASAVGGKRLVTDVTSSSTIYLGLHHSTYPFLAQSILRSGVHVLVARKVKWLEAIGGNFIDLLRNAGDIRSICQRHEPIFAMMDYCYDQTRSVCDAPFLSYPTRTPTGLLKLARRYQYDLAFLRPNGRIHDGISVTQMQSANVETIARWMNSLIEEQVLAEPSRWLLWASLDRRLKALDYDT